MRAQRGVDQKLPMIREIIRVFLGGPMRMLRSILRVILAWPQWKLLQLGGGGYMVPPPWK